MKFSLGNREWGAVGRCVLLGGLLGVVMGLSLAAGCGASKEQSRPASVPAAGSQPAATQQSAPAAPPAGQPSGVAAKPLAKADPEGLKELSPEDRALAEKQAVCPVSKEPLGSMGKPVKVVHAGRAVFLCCSGCEEDFHKEPARYLAEMDAGNPPRHDPGHQHVH